MEIKKGGTSDINLVTKAEDRLSACCLRYSFQVCAVKMIRLEVKVSDKHSDILGFVSFGKDSLLNVFIMLYHIKHEYKGNFMFHRDDLEVSYDDFMTSYSWKLHSRTMRLDTAAIFICMHIILRGFMNMVLELSLCCCSGDNVTSLTCGHCEPLEPFHVFFMD